MAGMVFEASRWLVGKMFGELDAQEFRKFIRMGIVFGCVIGAYWTIRVLKNALFMTLMGGNKMIPVAKTFSLIVLIPTVAYYSKLLNRYSRERMFYLLPMFYGICTVLFALAFSLALAPKEVILARTGLAALGNYALAFSWFVFVESFGSLAVALFWAFATEVTLPESAKRGFSFVVALGQVGSIVAPYVFTKFDSSAISILGGAGLMFGTVLAFRSLIKNTPTELMKSYHGKPMEAEENEEEPGFFEGLKILFSHNYLKAIFASIFVFEIVATLIDYQFNGAVHDYFGGDEKMVKSYLGDYGSLVNILTLACLLLGANNITKYLGVGVSLALVPVLIGGAFFAFLSVTSMTLTLGSLDLLRAILVSTKAVNYALTGPATKQLYIPTSHDVRFKAQAWIETFGSRASKETGAVYVFAAESFFPKVFNPAAVHAFFGTLTTYLGIALIAGWFGMTIYLGRVHKDAIANKKIVC